MARNDTPRGKIVRRLGVNIFGNDKYDRLLKRKPNGPGKGAKDRSRKKDSDYKLQLIEKQKLKYSYGLTEKQLRNIYLKSVKMKGKTDDTIIQLLEQRIDNIIYKAGFALTKGQARQMVTHGHFLVNKRKIDVPSQKLFPGDFIELNNKKSIINIIRSNQSDKQIKAPSWIAVDNDLLSVKVESLPVKTDFTDIVEMHRIIEFYAR